MEIIKFRIKNYKSIKDSGDCYFSKKITILAGKNESGKTTILEALSGFDKNILIKDDVRPIDDDNAVPDIAVTFKFTKKELKEFLNEINLKVDSSICEFTLHKKNGNDLLDSYYLEDDFQKLLLPLMDWHKIQEKIDSHREEYPEIARPVLYNEGDDAKYREQLISCRNKTTNQIVDGIQKKIPILNRQQIDELEQVSSLISYDLESMEISRAFIKKFIEIYLPYFILHTSQDNFPDVVKISELGNNSYIADLEVISKFKKELFMEGDAQRIANNEKKVDLDFNEKINKYWTQDSAKLEVKKDGDSLYFYIVEDDKRYKPSQRSQGKQWFLSFFIRICARIKEDRPNVILIDEPGLYLHAQAQKNLLDVLEKHTSDYPVVFSTHSPYLITEGNLENVRLVEKDITETRIIGKIHDPSISDKETLTPILTAIGLGMNDSITDLAKKNNIVVEGPEDVFYLNAFKLLSAKKDEPKINFINGGGSGNMGFVGSILEGWGCNVRYLFDNDQGGKNGEKNLSNPKTWSVLKEDIKKIPGLDGEAITDIFSKKDFKKYVLEDETLNYEDRNSQYLKKEKIDKVLKARKFYQKAQNNSSEIELSKDTMSKIKQLFNELGCLNNE